MFNERPSIKHQLKKTPRAPTLAHGALTDCLGSFVLHCSALCCRQQKILFVSSVSDLRTDANPAKQ